MTYRPKSRGEARVYKALQLLKCRIQTEVQIGNKLRLDFYVPDFSLGIEFDGSQHTEFNSFFYDSGEAFTAAKLRDKKKEEILEKKLVRLVRLSENDVDTAPDAESLKILILKRLSKIAESEREEW